jgi:hypothetical protein
LLTFFQGEKYEKFVFNTEFLDSGSDVVRAVGGGGCAGIYAERSPCGLELAILFWKNYLQDHLFILACNFLN